MKILGIETSTKQFGLAVAENKKIIRRREIILDKVLSDSIVPAIDRILKQSKVKLEQLDGFAVGVGPGSFTSLRVGLATVKALAFAAKKAVVGVSSLDAIALSAVKQDCDEICVIVDARRNLVYGALYEVKKGELKRKSDYQLVAISKLLDQVHGRTLFVGDGIKLFRSEIESRYAEAAKNDPSACVPLFAEEKFWYPAAVNIALLAMPRFSKKEFDDLDKLVPMYLYPDDCQVQRKEKQN